MKQLTGDVAQQFLKNVADLSLFCVSSRRDRVKDEANGGAQGATYLIRHNFALSNNNDVCLTL